MRSLLDRKAWAERLRRLNTVRIFVVVLTPLIWLLFVAIRRRRAYFQRILSDCQVSCFVECWTLIAKGKLIDMEAPLAGEINNATDYYLRRAVYARGEFSSFEQLLLRFPYVVWLTRDGKKPDELRARTFAAEHDLAPIFEKYANLFNYACFTASKEIEKLEVQGKEPPSVEYWRSTVRFNQLPKPLNDQTKASVVRRFYAEMVRGLKLSFARANYLKIDFTLSDLTALATLCGALLLFLGYVRIFILGAYFGFPFQNYFGISDYLTTSLNLTGQVLIGGILAAISAYASIATVHSYSVQQSELHTNSAQSKVVRIGYHFTGISAFIAAALAYFRLGYIDDLSALGALVYVGALVIGRSVSVFENPLKSYMALSIFYFSFAATLAGAIREIQRLNEPATSSPARALQFEDARYDEKEWQIIAFTTDYVIIRNRQTKQLLVRSRKELKSIEASQGASRPITCAGEVTRAQTDTASSP
ncbi:hypothetical protein [Bradyrhizobium sp. SZCCHNS3002]|uniref:hypothetical protein n=1 Tax=Bradyrhizobium sp. SZCCHNS3002 TaxID=3057310 RepID=UPI0028E33EE5|nr:hypothetical protein [Bradyrhizobium sp. SZCCHNS3002]